MQQDQIEVCQYFLGEHVDALDTINNWLDAEIIHIDQNNVRIHFTNWSSKYDQTLPKNSPRILKQWIKYQRIHIGNRADIFHPVGGWLQARVIEKDLKDQNKVKVHFVGYRKTFDIWVDIRQQNIAEVGRKTGAPGNAQNYNIVGVYKARMEKLFLGNIFLLARLRFRQKLFIASLKQHNFQLLKIKGDGNCLFRTFSDQIYGSQQFHDLIRKFCMQYIKIQRAYFEEYIDGDFNKYVSDKQKDGEWGDDVQIQAISQIYNVAVQIYVCSVKPMRTFHEQEQNTKTIRLSYHSNSHYNSLRTIPFSPLITEKPGTLQQKFIEAARIRRDRAAMDFNNAIQKSRKQFEKGVKIDVQVRRLAQQQDWKTQDKIQQLNNQQRDIQQVIKQQNQLQNVMKSSYNQFSKSSEQEYRRIVEESRRAQEEKEKAQLERISKESYNQARRKEIINRVVQAGFPQWAAQYGYQQVGDNQDLIIEHILKNTF